jgi:hypothetical protein
MLCHQNWHCHSKCTDVSYVFSMNNIVNAIDKIRSLSLSLRHTCVMLPHTEHNSQRRRCDNQTVSPFVWTEFVDNWGRQEGSMLERDVEGFDPQHLFPWPQYSTEVNNMWTICISIPSYIFMVKCLTMHKNTTTWRGASQSSSTNLPLPSQIVQSTKLVFPVFR